MTDTHNITLHIDYREEDIMDFLNDLNIIYAKENLEIGDIIYKRNNKEICIIERKTIHDYVSSMTDGRNKEQSFRLSKFRQEINDVIIIYMIEGDLPQSNYKFRSHITGEALFTSICDKIIRDKFFIYQTKNLNESIRFINKLFTKFNENIDVSKNDDYTKTINLHKKNQLTCEMWYKLCLAQIPSVSIDIATEIVKYYPTLSNLCMKYNSINEHEGKKLLSEIFYGKRRLGNVLSEKIYYFFNCKNQQTEMIEDIHSVPIVPSNINNTVTQNIVSNVLPEIKFKFKSKFINNK